MTVPKHLHFHYSDDLPRKARKAVQSLLLYSPLELPDRNKVILAIAEICTNFIRHSDTKPSRIDIKIDWDKINFSLSIQDNGSAIPASVEIADLDELLESEPNTSGYGMAILKAEFDTCRYDSGSHSHSEKKSHSHPETKSHSHPETKSQPNEWILTLPLSQNTTRYQIAIIDDDAIQLSMLTLYLEEHDIHTFDSPFDAINWLEHNTVDIIMSDIHMPELDGIAFRERLRSLKHLNTTPFIFLTGDQSKTLEHAIFRSDIDDFIVKPVQKDKILNVMDRVIQRSQNVLIQAYALLDSEVKQQLRPPVHEESNYRISTLSRSAHIGGGDCWHIENNVPDNMMRLILCDVAGHDIKASFNASRLHGFIQALSSIHLSDIPTEEYAAKALQSSNVWLSQFAPDLLTTMQCLTLEKDHFVFTNSGGVPPFLITNTANLASLPVTGPLLGLDSDPVFDSHHFSLDIGEALLLFTDGLIEVPNDPHKERVQLQKLSEMIQLARDKQQDLPSVLETFLEKISYNDDISIILIEKIA